MFARGIVLGLAIAALLLLLYLVVHVGYLEDLYRDLGSAALPAVTHFVFGPWRIVAPAAGAVGIGVVAYRRPVAMTPYIVLAVLVALAAGFTRYASRAPITALAGSITAD